MANLLSRQVETAREKNAAFVPPDLVLINKLDVDCEDTHPAWFCCSLDHFLAVEPRPFIVSLMVAPLHSTTFLGPSNIHFLLCRGNFKICLKQSLNKLLQVETIVKHKTIRDSSQA